MFGEVVIMAGLGLAAVVTAIIIGGPDAHDLRTVGVGMVGAAIGVWTAGRGGRAANGNGNGNGKAAPEPYVSIETEHKHDPTRR